MTVAGLIDFANLPEPEFIETLSFEEIRAAFINYLVDLDPTYSALLESDPVIKLIEVCAYRELLLRQRVNDVGRSNLVLYSTGGDLDHLAGFYDVVRLPDEGDEALRNRVIASISGRSTAGPVDWYRAAALRASPRVRDAAVYRIGPGPDIRIAVLATDNFGEPDALLLEQVREVVTADDVRVISDRVEVVPATGETVDVVADIWLHPSAPQTVFDNLETTLRAALAEQGGLGFDLTRSWLTATLHQPGVHKVEIAAPVADVEVSDNQAAKLGNVTLNYQGRGR